MIITIIILIIQLYIIKFYTYLTLPTAGAAVAKPLFKAKFAFAALRADLVEVANNLATILYLK